MKDLAAAEQDGIKWADNHHAKNLNGLRALPASELVSAGRFGPIIDGWLLPESPNAINANGRGLNVPVITGYQANDSMLFSPPSKSPDEYEKRIASLFGDMAGEFNRLYPGGTLDAFQKAFEAAARDRERVSMFLWAKQRAAAQQRPVFTYFFTRAIPWPQHPEFGAFHSGELPYFFNNLNLLDRSWEPIDHQLSETVSAYLKNFAASGNPNSAPLPNWPAVNPSSPETLEIGEKIQPMPLADNAKFDFWVRYFHSQQATKAPVF